jgi:hypothetical protein
MAPRKKTDAEAVQGIEQPREQPVIANVAPALPIPPLNFASVRVERPAARPASSARTASKGNKGGGKSDGGKKSGGKGTTVGGGHSQGIVVGHRPPKKKTKKKGLMVKGYSLGERESEPRKRTTKAGLRKPGPRK